MDNKIFRPGNTKCVELKSIEKTFNLPFQIYAKIENTNPTGSIKDRTVYNMLLNYQKDRDLNGATIIEATSGNTGISLAYYSKIFNYHAIIVMPKSMSKQRRDMIASYGAELVLVTGGMKECEDEAIRLTKKYPNSFIFDQFNQRSNYVAHYETIKEIINDCPKCKYIVAGIGTGGTITGIGKYIKEHNHNIKVVGVEPIQSPLLTKGIANAHLIQGIGANFVPSILDLSILDCVVDVDDKKAIEHAKLIRSVEEIDVGISSGASLLGAITYGLNKGINNEIVVCIFPDKGDRYSW